MDGSAMVSLLVLSLLLQAAAAALALYLVRVTGWRLAWLAIAGAVLLMAVRRGLALCRVFAGEPFPVDPAAELLALAVPALMLVGLAAVVPVCRSGRRAEQARRESEERYRRMVDEASAGVWLLDSQANTVYVNQGMARMLGYGVEEILGRPLFHFVDPRSRAQTELNFKRHRLGFQEQYDVRFRCRDGSSLWTIFSANLLSDEQGRFLGVMGVAMDVSHRLGADQRALLLARHDPLTGLPNRDLLADRLDQALAQGRRYGRGIAVLFVDLDQFKPINDTLGHQVGDAVLREVARRLASRVRRVDTVARYGGDEFVVVLQDLAEAREAEHLAEAFVELLGEPYRVDGWTCQLGASIGISLFPADGEDGETLIRKADEAMYLAKQSDSDKVRYYREPAPSVRQDGGWPAAQSISGKR